MEVWVVRATTKPPTAKPRDTGGLGARMQEAAA